MHSEGLKMTIFAGETIFKFCRYVISREVRLRTTV